MNITFREFTGSDADYELLLMIDNATDDRPKSMADLRVEEEWWKPEQLHLREFVYLDQELVGATIHYNQVGDESGIHSGFCSFLPPFEQKGLDKPVLERLIDSARELKAECLNTNAKDTHVLALQAIRELGFEPTISYIHSRLDVAAFDASLFTAKCENAQSDGILIADAESQRVKDVELFVGLERMFGREPSEQFWENHQRERRSGGWFPESQFGAWDGDRLVGIAFMCRVAMQPDLAQVSFTTTHPDYRRRGIATALKVASIEAAKNCGIRSAITCNESTIPMLQLNVQLGFKKDYERLCFKLTF